MYYLIPDRKDRHLERDAIALYNALNSRYDLEILYPNEYKKVNRGIIFWNKNDNLIMNKKESIIFIGENYSWSKPHAQNWIQKWGAVVASSKEIYDKIKEAKPTATNVYQITPGFDSNIFPTYEERAYEEEKRKGVVYKYYDKPGFKDLKGMGKIQILDIRRIIDVPYSQMPHVYDNLDILVVPSKVEGVPRVALEALACGVYLITTKVGIMPELKEKGFKFAWFEEGKLKEQLDKITIKEIKEAANFNKTLIKMYNWETVIPKWESIIKSLNWETNK